jgi:hypothetical protein
MLLLSQSSADGGHSSGPAPSESQHWGTQLRSEAGLPPDEEVRRSWGPSGKLSAVLLYVRFILTVQFKVLSF